MDYTSLENENKNKNDWKTSLYTCDSESCILSLLLPCHIYSKIINKNYLLNFLSYGFVCLSIYNIYYWLNYINQNKCPSNKTEQCVGLGDNCNNNYIYINNIPTKCIYHSDANVCTYNSISCIELDEYRTLNIYLSIFSSISYLFLYLMNYNVREKIKLNKSIKDTYYDIIAVICCYPCGLAQSYREISIV